MLQILAESTPDVSTCSSLAFDITLLFGNVFFSLIYINNDNNFSTRTESSIKHKSDVRAVTRWPDGVC